MKPPSHLRALQALELTLRLGSFKAAAAALGITPAAAGQRVRALEEYLGFELLVRGRYGLSPAPALKDALTDLSDAFDRLQAVSNTLDFQRVEEIHIIADPDWADHWLEPRLAAYKAWHKNLLFCVNGVGDVPMRPGQADVMVTLDAETEPGKDVLYRDYIWAIGSPENFDRVKARDSRDRLQGFPLVHLNCYDGDIGWPTLVKERGLRREAPADRGVRYQRVQQGLDAIRADVGALLCGASLSAAEVQAGEAVPFLEDPKGLWARRSYHVAYRQATQRRPQLVQFRAWLREQADLTAAALAEIASNPPPTEGA